MFISRSAKVATAVAALALTLPVAAQAATTVGSVAGNAVQNTAICPDEQSCTLLGDNATIAADGVVTGWHLKSGSVGGEVRLRVLRPAGGGAYTGAGTGAPWRITRDDPYVNDFPDRLPVKAGDVLAVDNSSNALFLADDAGTVRAFTPSVADGATAAPTGTEQGVRRVLMSADIERDADGDGYGDETQDACPAADDRHVAPCTGPVADVVVEQQLTGYTATRRAFGLIIKAYNRGPSTATNVIVRDSVLAGGTPAIDGCAPEFVAGLAALRCPIGDLAPGQTKTITANVVANDGASEVRNFVSAGTTDQGDPYSQDNTMTRTYNVAPTFTTPKLDAPKFLVAGRQDLLREVHVLFTLSEPATMELKLKGPSGPRTARFNGYKGLNATRWLFSSGGQLAGLKPGIYVGILTATDAGYLQGRARKFKFRVYDKRPS